MHDDIDLEKLSNSELYIRLLGKTPFVKLWMEPYLPKNVFLCDIVVICFVTAAGLVVILGSLFILQQFFREDVAAFINFIPMGLILWFGFGPIFSRYTVATIKSKTIKGRKSSFK